MMGDFILAYKPQKSIAVQFARQGQNLKILLCTKAQVLLKMLAADHVFAAALTLHPETGLLIPVDIWQ